MKEFELKYKSALGSATTMYACAKESNDKKMIQSLELIFPELKKTKDELIKEELIHFLETCRDPRFVGNRKQDEWIEWLEKQDKQKEINLVKILKHYPRETELYSPLYGKLWLAEVDEEYEIITCYKHCLDEGCTRAILEQEDTIFFYSNGTTGLPDCSVSKDCMLFLYNNEKQGEQKPNYHKFKIGDTIHCGDSTQPVTITGLSVDSYQTNSVYSHIPFSEEDKWELITSWSEEDETMFTSLLGTLTWATNNNYHCSEVIPKYIHWLENLKQRLNGTE